MLWSRLTDHLWQFLVVDSSHCHCAVGKLRFEHSRYFTFDLWFVCVVLIRLAKVHPFFVRGMDTVMLTNTVCSFSHSCNLVDKRESSRGLKKSNDFCCSLVANWDNGLIILGIGSGSTGDSWRDDDCQVTPNSIDDVKDWNIKIFSSFGEMLCDKIWGSWVVGARDLSTVCHYVTDTLGRSNPITLTVLAQLVQAVLSAHFYSSELLFSHAKKYLLNDSLLKASYTFGMLTRG